MENLDNNIPHVSHFENIEVTPQRSSLEKPGFFQRFVESFLPSKEPVEAKLSKKVCCHTENAKKVQAQLKNIREELKAEVDAELSPMITEVINPMLRDVKKIHRMMKRENGECAAIKHYKEWTEDAKLWVELYSKNKDKEAIKAAIVKHIITKSMETIEKDIRFIEKYFRQSLEQAQLDPEELSRIRIDKARALAEHVEKLHSLKVLPEAMSFDSVSNWRQGLDDQRAKHFDDALHVIDS